MVQGVWIHTGSLLTELKQRVKMLVLKQRDLVRPHMQA